MRGISKRFGPVKALATVDLQVRPGTIHALVGENGAGKSTLMKILSGACIPDEGVIEINSRPVHIRSCADGIAAGVSMIYQELDLAEELTVAENVFLGAEPGAAGLFVNNRSVIERTRELADYYQFDVNPSGVVEDLSTGQCQVVEILKALRRRARIIVMDEPTSSLSESEAARLFGIIRRLREDGIAIIYISHRLEEIVDLADHITVLRDGQVVHDSPMTDIDIPKIVHHMVGRTLTDFYPPRDVTPAETMVEVRGITTAMLRDISFDVRRGEILGLAGLVGAGRTELARAVFGVDPVSAGRIRIEGRDMKITSPGEAIAQGIAYLTEDRKRTGLCLELPCSWNITLPNLKRLGMDRVIRPAREKDVAQTLGDKLSIKWADAESPADSLSGGNQQKVLIARWLLAESRFLIFDEPTRGIDVGAKKEIYTLLNSLARDGRAILFISSELPELLGVADRILVMRRGKLVGDLNAAQTNSDQIMHLAAVEETS